MNYTRYVASEGKVFDWADLEAHRINGEIRHLYANTLFLNDKCSIDEYIEIDAPTEEELF